MAIPLLDTKILSLHRALKQAAIPHAFGGAIALAYYGVPRGTEDIDLNLFVRSVREPDCLAALQPLGVETASPAKAPAHQALWIWDPTPIHAFFSYDPFHDSCRERACWVPFADQEIPILGAEDITLFKILYDRPKDRSEVREVLLCMGEALDVDYLKHWLKRLVGRDDPRLGRFLDSVEELRGDPA